MVNMRNPASEISAEALLAAADQLRTAAGHQMVADTSHEDLLREAVGHLIDRAAELVEPIRETTREAGILGLRLDALRGEPELSLGTIKNPCQKFKVNI